MFGDGSHAIHIAEAFDSKEIAEKYAQQIKSALKLQELVKERTEQLFPVCSASDDYDEALMLQSLLDESQTTDKEKGLEGTN